MTLSRRDWLRTCSATGLGVSMSMSGWMSALAADAADHPKRRKSCILLWMSGGPSQMDTFDLKPGHANGGAFKEIKTAVPGIRISEHLPKLAGWMNDMALIRSMTTREGDHGRATFHLRTGYLPAGPIQYPPLGALVSKELGNNEAPLPGFVSIAPYRQANLAAFGPGYLGPRYAPLVVGDARRPVGPPGSATYNNALAVQNLAPPKDVPQANANGRIDLLRKMEKDFAANHPAAAAQSHESATTRAVRLMRTDAGKAFDLSNEPANLREAYGGNLFGQSCLLARRLVEQGVPFIEITLGGLNGGIFGWDTHGQNFPRVQQLSQILDAGWSSLMKDLKDRGLLDSTLIVWMGEFGRTPRINPNRGRDHYPGAWSTVLAGGGIKGGQVIGATTPGGERVAKRPVKVEDLLSTVCHAVGVDPLKHIQSNVNRPIRIVDKAAKPIKEVLS